MVQENFDPDRYLADLFESEEVIFLGKSIE